jgi:hypothetical protein
MDGVLLLRIRVVVGVVVYMGRPVLISGVVVSNDNGGDNNSQEWSLLLLLLLSLLCCYLVVVGMMGIDRVW